jgi:hypothetical protein
LSSETASRGARRDDPTLVADGREAEASGSGNEANTKALLIEPMIAALGWDPADLDVRV